MKEKIGETSGRIWQILQKKGETNVLQLPRLLNEKSATVNQAIGWLAREDKIEFRSVGAKTFISLTETEKNI